MGVLVLVKSLRAYVVARIFKLCCDENWVSFLTVIHSFCYFVLGPIGDDGFAANLTSMMFFWGFWRIQCYDLVVVDGGDVVLEGMGSGIKTGNGFRFEGGENEKERSCHCYRVQSFRPNKWFPKLPKTTSWRQFKILFFLTI